MYAVRYAFRCARCGLQKRNVAVRYAFRYALLTLLKVLCGGTLPKKAREKRLFYRFHGAKIEEKDRFQGAKFTRKCLFSRVCEK